MTGALLVWAETRASAACTDHTFFSFQANPTESNSRGARSTSQTSTAPGKPSAPLPCGQCPGNAPIPGDAPCRGPFCSGDPLPQGVPITSTKVNPSQEQWSLWLVLPEGAETPTSAWLALSQLVIPLDRTTSIFHPPRHG